MTLILVLATWAIVLVLVLALCRAARAGDARMHSREAERRWPRRAEREDDDMAAAA